MNNTLTSELPRAAALCSMRLLCHVRMFKPQFAPLVESGVKCQTVRPVPKRILKAGDRISLRMWTGKPYRSKQRVLRESIISEVAAVRIADTGREILMAVGGKLLTPEEICDFGKADGFRGAADFVNWFDDTHGLPFEGVVIKWHNDKITDADVSAPPNEGKTHE